MTTTEFLALMAGVAGLVTALSTLIKQNREEGRLVRQADIQTLRGIMDEVQEENQRLVVSLSSAEDRLRLIEKESQETTLQRDAQWQAFMEKQNVSWRAFIRDMVYNTNESNDTVAERLGELAKAIAKLLEKMEKVI